MTRCAWPAVGVLAACALAAAAAFAHPARNFPASALRGELQVLQPPEVLLNGRAARLAPGARIRGENNLLVLSGALAGAPKQTVHYTLDESGLVKDVWLLSPAERAKRPWPTTPQEAARWSFDPIAQTWTRP